jgi:hypothetical protein
MFITLIRRRHHVNELFHLLTPSGLLFETVYQLYPTHVTTATATTATTITTSAFRCRLIQ